jgi:4'-phosphopantetheinyl transferase EntD
VSTIAPLFPNEVVVEEADPDRIRDELPAEEAALVEGAVKKRVAEFTAGRVLARRALERLGIADAPPLLRGARGEPLWPDGVIGSITHKTDLCVVVAAKRERIRGLGIDVEDATDLDEELFDRICTPNELTWLESKHPSNHGLLGKLLFSAKECVYKCRYPMTGEFLGFADVEIEPDLVEGSFAARIVGRENDGWPDDSRVHARWRVAEKKVITTMVVK